MRLTRWLFPSTDPRSCSYRGPFWSQVWQGWSQAWHWTRLPYWWRRWRWGFDPKDLWSLDYAFFRWLKPRLARYRESPWLGTPFLPGYDPETDEDYEAMHEEWDRILDEIEWFLDYMTSEEGDWPTKGFDDDELYRRVMRGYGLLVKYLPAMWE